MLNSKTMKKLLTILLLLITSSHLFAHYLWIELGAPAKIGEAVEVRIYYGEYNEGVREIKGGRLEELSGIEAWVISPDGKRSPLTVTTDAKFFKTTFTPQLEGKYVIVAVNKVREVVDWSKSDIGIVRPVYYTSQEITIGKKQSASAIQVPEETELFVKPSPTGENSFMVYFKGQPLPKAKVFFHAPNEWSKELVTDANGLVSFNPLWKGQYVVECIHLEKVPGNFKGKDYEAVRHRATWVTNIK
jgi:uncharacterized GH25 family protein